MKINTTQREQIIEKINIIIRKIYLKYRIIYKVEKYIKNNMNYETIEPKGDLESVKNILQGNGCNVHLTILNAFIGHILDGRIIDEGDISLIEEIVSRHN